ncbi:hypothetical protein BBJ28_00026169, partial [Nothophytophthora sp. Chile5]
MATVCAGMTLLRATSVADVERALQCGEDVDCCSDDGKSPLMRAAQRGFYGLLGVMHALLAGDAGIDPANLGETSAMIAGHGQVFARLDDLYAQLQPLANVKEATTAMDRFVSVLHRFYLLLKRREADALKLSSSVVARFCAARTGAQTIGSFHHDIDRLLTLAGLREVSTAATEDLTPSLTSSRGNSSNCVIEDIHDWNKVWNKKRRDQLRTFEAWLQDTPALKEHLSDRKAREEAQMLLQFEALKRKRSYPPSVLEAMAGALAALEELDGGEAAEAVPNWFVPPYEVELGDFIGRGSFAEVYHGKWFDTDVVVKKLMPQ